jgi:SAM-dependent methyltransferase
MHGSAFVFESRRHCISCGSSSLDEVARGSFGDEPLRSFIESDPWGENPLPVLESKNWSLVECCACGQRFHREILSPDWNQIRFSRWMTEDSIRQFETDHRADYAVRYVQHVLRLKDHGVKRVLDFGCGFGQFVQMCRLFSIEALGVDPYHAQRSAGGNQIYAELNDVPGSFDAITMFEVLEHLEDPLAVLKALRRRLNASGLMIVEVPDTSGVNRISSRDEYYKIHPLDHVNAFTPASLDAIMDQVGFERIAKRPAYVTTSPKQLAKDALRPIFKRHATTQAYFRLRMEPEEGSGR